MRMPDGLKAIGTSREESLSNLTATTAAQQTERWFKRADSGDEKFNSHPGAPTYVAIALYK